MSVRSDLVRAASGAVLAGLFLGAAAAGPGPRTPVRRPASPAPATAPSRKPVDAARQARVLEEEGHYAGALEELRLLRTLQGPDADVELMLALDEARVGLLDSAWARLHGPLLSAALADTAGVARRTEYPFQREGMLVNGSFDGWYWYVARARAELALQRGDWTEALSMASRAAAARPMSGKDALLLAVAAGKAGDERLGEAAAAWASYLEPWLPESRFLSGVWAWRGGRRGEAREHFAAAVALDSSWRVPVLALARLRLPGSQPDSLPARFLTGVRACGMITSAKRPKQEEFVQFDTTPMLVYNPQVQPVDSLRARMKLKKPTQLFVQVLVGERGQPLMAELPWFTESRLPAGVVHSVLEQIGAWRFVAARKFGQSHRAWATVEYVLQP